jgi:hypothetical protein
MSSDVQEVRELLGALTPLVAGCSEVLNQQGVGNALYGLRSMSSDVQEVRDLLGALTFLVAGCSEVFIGLLAMR